MRRAQALKPTDQERLVALRTKMQNDPRHALTASEWDVYDALERRLEPEAYAARRAAGDRRFNIKYAMKLSVADLVEIIKEKQRLLAAAQTPYPPLPAEELKDCTSFYEIFDHFVVTRIGDVWARQPHTGTWQLISITRAMVTAAKLSERARAIGILNQIRAALRTGGAINAIKQAIEEIHPEP